MLSNGKLLLDLAEENDLIITNTTFQKRSGKLWTYLSDMNGSKSQIDYILINRKWKNSVKNVEAYSTFSSIGSDHRIVTAELNVLGNTQIIHLPMKEICIMRYYG